MVTISVNPTIVADIITATASDVGKRGVHNFWVGFVEDCRTTTGKRMGPRYGISFYLYDLAPDQDQ